MGDGGHEVRDEERIGVGDGVRVRPCIRVRVRVRVGVGLGRWVLGRSENLGWKDALIHCLFCHDRRLRRLRPWTSTRLA